MQSAKLELPCEVMRGIRFLVNAFLSAPSVAGYDSSMTKAELIEQVKAMTEEEAAEVRLIYAPDWPSNATSIEEIRKRTGTTPMSREDFDRHFGSLPTDGER